MNFEESGKQKREGEIDEFYGKARLLFLRNKKFIECRLRQEEGNQWEILVVAL